MFIRHPWKQNECGGFFVKPGQERDTQKKTPLTDIVAIRGEGIIRGRCTRVRNGAREGKSPMQVPARM